MAGGNLSPRQKMINMMYLVLTALLALNVSKEVLNSFFEVNKGITRTTTNFNAKNGDTYAAFDAAAEVNPVKAGPYRKQAYEIKDEADKLVASLQEMKYNLVLAADKKVYLGYDSEIKDNEGDLIEEKSIELSWDLLSDNQKLMSIGALTNKDDRHASGNLFYIAKREDNIATVLKTDLISYKNLLLSIAEGNESLLTSINETCNYDDKQVKGKKQLWEYYNFYDMPSVGALTLLSKMQSDVRNTEADIINMLRENIDAGSLKFTSAEAIQIPNSNFVLKGDSFRAQIFISAKDTTQAPSIYVGAYDSLGVGKYQMIGDDYETVKIVNGKGMFARRATSEGNQKWGGLIAMKTDNGIKMYPFKGEYLVASKSAVVSPTEMNLLYIEVDNPVEISVPGYQASDLKVKINQGGSIKGSKGKYIVRPGAVTKKGKEAIITVSVSKNGKTIVMGAKKFRVKDVPDPLPVIPGSRLKDGAFPIKKATLLAQGGIESKMPADFAFKGIYYTVRSFGMIGILNGENAEAESKSPQFTPQMKKIIKNTKSGTKITITNIKAKRKGVNKLKELGNIVILIK